jgi:cell division protein FtsQ
VKRAAPEALPAEILGDEEPRYLRRQKPVEVRKKSFGKRLRESWRVWLMRGGIGIATCTGIAIVLHFFLFSPAVILAAPEQVEVTGNQYVLRETVVNLFAVDQGRSVLRVPLEERRASLERIAWVGEAHVLRILPNRIRVEIVERQPVAFLRTGSDLALIDASGVILERPAQGNFHLPVVAGVAGAMPRAEREHRMKMFIDFLQETEQVRAGANEHLSEADLADATDLRATLAGLPNVAGSSDGPQAVLVHFGASDFGGKFRLLLENYPQWRAVAGHVESIDLRFRGQVVVNPESRQSSARP